MRPLRLDLGLLLPVAAAVAFAACNGGGDDDDDTTSPSPTPVQVDSCQVVWATPDPGGESSFDFFLVDAPLAQWTTGTKSYTVNGPLGIGA